MLGLNKNASICWIILSICLDSPANWNVEPKNGPLEKQTPSRDINIQICSGSILNFRDVCFNRVLDPKRTVIPSIPC